MDKEKLLLRFNKFVDKTEGCWNWIGGKMANKRYGSFHIGSNNRSAHRVSYELYKGPLGKLHVLHKCDNGLCVNPDHLFLGTHTENMRDASNKNRFNRDPEKQPNHKLTWTQVKRIRKIYESKLLFNWEIAKLYDVKESTIDGIVYGKSWKVQHTKDDMVQVVVD